MSKKIICIERPFVLNKTMTVYEDGNKIDMASYTADNREEVLFALMQKHDIDRIDLVGPKKYIAGIKQQIEETNATKYDYKNITVNII